MILVELSSVPVEALPVAEFRDHLRLGTGFSDDAAQDTLLEALLRSSMAAIEGKTQKALLSRSFRWRITAWRGFQREQLPLAPITQISGAKIIEADGVETVIVPTSYVLEEDAHHPAFASRGFGLPVIPISGAAEIEFVAGYSADWAGVPSDLKQAVLVLAADFHEHRHGEGADGALPTRVLQLLAPYRPMRLFGRRS